MCDCNSHSLVSEQDTSKASLSGIFGLPGNMSEPEGGDQVQGKGQLPVYKDHAQGQDQLPEYQDPVPQYQLSLEFYSTLLMKTEFDTPWSNRQTPLQAVVLELNSNQLNIYEFKADKATISTLKALFKYQNYDDSEAPNPCPDMAEEYFFDADAYGEDGVGEKNMMMLSRLRKRLALKKLQKLLKYPLPTQFYNNEMLLEPTSDAAVYRRFAQRHRGALIRSLTLLNLQVGEALSTLSTLYKEDRQHAKNSYTLIHYRNTLRVRIEYLQMLFHCWSFHGMIHWYRNLTVGRDLCTPIDDRRDSVLKSIPRSFTVANNNLLAMSAREALTFNPETRKLVHRDSVVSVESDDCSCFSSSSHTSTHTGASSACSRSDACARVSACIHGSRVVCLENYYTGIEKQFISNCIPVLNSYDKWQGSRLTISDYRDFLPENDKANLNEGDKLFISHGTFESLVRHHRKRRVKESQRECKDFFVSETGLVGIAA